MELNDYQKFVCSMMHYPQAGQNVVYPALGLAGEAGEVAEKVKKFWRDRKSMNAIEHMDAADGHDILLELGDVLWYVVAIATELGYTLQDVAGANVQKLNSRKARGTLAGQGDNR